LRENNESDKLEKSVHFLLQKNIKKFESFSRFFLTNLGQSAIIPNCVGVRPERMTEE
jgi:hypothetical protein